LAGSLDLDWTHQRIQTLELWHMRAVEALTISKAGLLFLSFPAFTPAESAGFFIDLIANVPESFIKCLYPTK